ncbi:DUF4440 domain-containing protein [Nocardioides taihuensis]|uniref:DUF4440 domain-containing protein n=1 Tax=Nocardioides taihuensis TaxID=1835606 RepID=A0ABW0BMA5_9ACTN
MDDTHEVLGAEQEGWVALADNPVRATAFWEHHLDDEVLFLLPGGVRIDERDAALEAMAGPPWSSYRLDDLRALRLADGVVVVGYAVSARREAGSPYDALVSSTWVWRPGGWRLSVHQQTPA